MTTASDAHDSNGRGRSDKRIGGARAVAGRSRQPAGLTKHPAWVVGHIVGAMDLVLKMLGQKPNFSHWDKLFGWGSEPAADATLYPSKDELLAALECQHARAADALRQASPELLAKPIENEVLRKIMPTVGTLAASITTNHEAIHLGQLSAWRLAMGLGAKF